MQKLKGTLLVILVLLCGLANGQEKDKDVMLKKIFTVLKNGDEEGFVKLFPDAAVTKSLIMSFFEKDTTGEASREMVEAIMQKITDEDLQKDYREKFKRIRDKAAASNIDLSKGILVSYTADSIKKGEEELNVSVLSGKIYFNADGQECFIRYDNIIWLESKGWYGVTINRIDKKSRENETEPTVEEQLMDSLQLMEMDTASVELPPPPPKKVKPATQPAKPVKSKTSSAARKPDH